MEFLLLLFFEAVEAFCEVPLLLLPFLGTAVSSVLRREHRLHVMIENKTQEPKRVMLIILAVTTVVPWSCLHAPLQHLRRGSDRSPKRENSSL